MEDDLKAQEQIKAKDQTVLRAVHIEREFVTGNTTLKALKGVDLSIDAGQLVALKGRSGSGKTTLLNIMGGLDQPTSGQMFFQQQEISALPERERTLLRRAQYGFIFQSFALMPLLSAEENVELSLRMAGVERRFWSDRVAECLDFVGLTGRKKHRPFELSGGEQQRVAIARAIAHKPTLILADEPTAELDTRMGFQVMQLFRELVESEGITICMTTHDPAIMEVVDRVYAMVDGKLIEEAVKKEE
ncbi:ABC transporter ATP-binding protein [Bacillus horti]|uniref:ABC transport system ATP-binding protein n=1 Tax=Caldalkalibacillus horti TaxID=77523 RepID=A0ABT9W2A4_9BACI|nr:putative ABC transport system ATP-binding protein [Bacillus horti]